MATGTGQGNSIASKEPSKYQITVNSLVAVKEKIESVFRCLRGAEPCTGDTVVEARDADNIHQKMNYLHEMAVEIDGRMSDLLLLVNEINE